jgi:hypothetical protein
MSSHILAHEKITQEMLRLGWEMTPAAWLKWFGWFLHVSTMDGKIGGILLFTAESTKNRV